MINDKVESPCDCYEVVDGYYVNRCDCGNPGDFATMENWCSDMYEEGNTSTRVTELEKQIETLEADIAGRDEFLELAFEVYPNLAVDIEAQRELLK